METKLSKLKSAYSEGKYGIALRIAAEFPDLGADRSVIKMAHEVGWNPDFYRQLGKDPDQLFQNGVDALARRYSLPPRSTS